jgi:iron(III) transport system substrate-binding protein
MKHRTVLAGVLTALLSISILTGCGKASKEGQQPASATTPAKGQVVNLYSGRNYAVDEVLYAEFTKRTGIKVNVVQGNAEELIERLKREGESTPADLFITVDGGVLNNAKEGGMLQPMTSPTLEANVPKTFWDKENQWIGLGTRARVIAYSKERVKPEQLSTYEDLASDKWKGKVLVRSSTSLYNQSLVAGLIEANGEQGVLTWAQGLVKNLARKPEGGDRDQVKAIAAGGGDVAIINTYYYGQMLVSKDAEEVKAAEKVALFFPNQTTTGTHVNISGAGLAKHAKNRENAIKFIEFLTGEDAQALFAKEGFEFPVNPKAPKPDLFKSWGEFKVQQIDWAKLGTNNKKALELMTKAAWQ